MKVFLRLYMPTILKNSKQRIEQFGYFSSTLQLLTQQIYDFIENNYTSTKERYWLCLGTIKLGDGGGIGNDAISSSSAHNEYHNNVFVDLSGTRSDFPLSKQ